MSWKIYPISEFKNHQDCWQRLNQKDTGSPLLELAFIISPMLHAFSSVNAVLVRVMRVIIFCWHLGSRYLPL